MRGAHRLAAVLRNGRCGGLGSVSMSELVDLYDPVSATVTGTATRERVRAENLPHAATAVLLVDPAGRVYVHRRTDDKDVYPGMWDCWAGVVVAAGEAPLEAARRELAEELGIELPAQDLEPAFTRWWHDAFAHYLAFGYRARYRPERHGAVAHQTSEVAEGGWLTAGQLRELLDDPARPFVPDGRAALASLVDGLTGEPGPQPPADAR